MTPVEGTTPAQTHENEYPGEWIPQRTGITVTRANDKKVHHFPTAVHAVVDATGTLHVFNDDERQEPLKIFSRGAWSAVAFHRVATDAEVEAMREVVAKAAVPGMVQIRIDAHHVPRQPEARQDADFEDEPLPIETPGGDS